MFLDLSHLRGFGVSVFIYVHVGLACRISLGEIGRGQVLNSILKSAVSSC